MSINIPPSFLDLLSTNENNPETSTNIAKKKLINPK